MSVIYIDTFVMMPMTPRPRQTLLRRSLVAAVLSAVAGGSLGVVMAAPAQAAVVVGVCSIIVGEPHPSAHVQGNINSYGRLTCTIGMNEIYVRADLERSNGTIWNGSAQSYVNTTAGRTFTSTRAIPCAGNSGTYRTRVSVTFRSPTGVNPSYHSSGYQSIWRQVACAGQPMSLNTKDTSSSVVTLTVYDDGTVRETAPAELVHMTGEELSRLVPSTG